MSELERNNEEHAELVEEEAQLIIPAVDIYETEDDFMVMADMPGLDPNQIDIQLDRETLIINGVSEVEGLQKAKYERTFRVMRGLDPATVAADYNQGVLKVRLPKPTSMKPHRIQVTAG